jgi:hypothetical protein
MLEEWTAWTIVREREREFERRRRIREAERARQEETRQEPVRPAPAVIRRQQHRGRRAA